MGLQKLEKEGTLLKFKNQDILLYNSNGLHNKICESMSKNSNLW